MTQSNNVTAAHLVAQLSGNNAGNETRKADEIIGEFDGCFDHVIESVAEFEGLWLIARYILTTNRSTLALYFLKHSCFYAPTGLVWDERTVQKALFAVRDKSKQERLEKKLKEAADHEDLDTADHKALDSDDKVLARVDGVL